MAPWWCWWRLKRSDEQQSTRSDDWFARCCRNAFWTSNQYQAPLCGPAVYANRGCEFSTQGDEHFPDCICSCNGLIMLLFFRSFRAVMFSMIIIGVLVVWTLGTLALFGYKITPLTGLIPPVIVTIGITNAIYLLNKYHLEFQKTKTSTKPFLRLLKKMVWLCFWQPTVAIGFLTLLATDITILREFGIVAGINILALFFVCLVMIPSVFSWRLFRMNVILKHLNFRILNKFLSSLIFPFTETAPGIYAASLLLVLFSVYGMMQLVIGFVYGRWCSGRKSRKKDLSFLNRTSTGWCRSEIVVQFITKKKRPVLDVRNLGQIEEFESFLIQFRWCRGRCRW